MAVLGTYTKLLIDEFDFSGASNALTVTTNVNPLETTVFQATGTTYLPGLPGGEITHNGYYNGKGAGMIEQEIKARLGTTDTVYTAALGGTNIDACPAYVTKSTWGQQLTIDMPVAELITLSGQWPAVMGMSRGLRIYDGTLSSTGTQTARDFASAGSSGGTAYLFVQSISGTATNATIDIESATTEGGSYSSEGTFTFSDVGVQVVTMSGTVNRWLRLNVTSLGGATNFAVVCIACTTGVTQ